MNEHENMRLLLNDLPVDEEYRHHHLGDINHEHIVRELREGFRPPPKGSLQRRKHFWSRKRVDIDEYGD